MADQLKEFYKQVELNNKPRPQTGEYGATTNANDIEPSVDLTGKNVIVTGGYAGIGYETVRAFALKHARVFIVGRDKVKGEKAATELKTATNNEKIEFIEMDLASLESIRQFAKKFNALNIPLHYLINNAGVMACPKGKTVDGFETQMGVNHFGHFLLTNLLLPRLIEAAPARVISVASSGHVYSPIRWSDINWEKDNYVEFDAYNRYGQSKTANILFAVELTRRYKEKGVIANALHPGSIQSDLQRHLTPEVMQVAFSGGEKMMDAMKFSVNPKTPQQGAATSLYAALSPKTSEGGKFYDDCQEAVDPAAKPYALDPEEAKKLWDYSLKAVGLSQ